jgi:uncharacterized protein (DUF488 family)
MPDTASPSLFSIGHSSHDPRQFLALLRQHGVQLVVDIRSHPVSQYASQFNRASIETLLDGAGIDYEWLGDRLGGRPSGAQFYDDEGHVLYGRIAQEDWFSDGLAQLVSMASRRLLVMMCSEENPADCHRFLLVTRVLRDLGVTVTHIRGDGSIMATEGVPNFGSWADTGAEQASLFGGSVRSQWRSTRSVSPSGRRSRSSKPSGHTRSED